jgi:hypothetical protein
MCAPAGDRVGRKVVLRTNRHRIAIVAAALAVLAAALPAPTSGRAGAARTFSGTCHFSGQVVFQPPLTSTPQTIRQRVRLPGTCSGTLTDRRGRTHELSDAPVTFVERSRAENASCAGGTAAGRGALRFRHGRIRFAFSETRTGGAAVASAQGARGGSAHGARARDDRRGLHDDAEHLGLSERKRGPHSRAPRATTRR